MKRATRSEWVIAVSALLLASCGRTPAPRLLLVTIDTCRADRLGCYGGRVKTPALDGLAARGALFEDASAPVALTRPSHGSVLTGLYPDRLGVPDNGSARIPTEARTLAEILGEAGYETAAFVAAFPLEKRFGADQGFAVYDDTLKSSAARGEGRLDEAGQDLAGRLFYDEREAVDVADAAIPWLARVARGERPFFGWVHFFDPHAVYRPPARFAALYGPDSYDGEIAYVDEQIGRLLDALGDLSGTTVVVVADHGESLGEHGEVSHGLFVYQSTIRVPWILAGPGIPAGRRIATPVSLVDVAPTILELLGLPIPPDVDGESVVPRLAGAESAESASVYGECLAPQLHYGWAPLRFVRSGRWKYIEAPTPELYDLAADPDETRNLADAHPNVVRRLAAELTRHAARGGRLEPDGMTLDAASRERLERLGYVGTGSAEPAGDPGQPGGRDPKEMVGFFNKLQQVPTLMVSGRLAEASGLLGELRAEDPTNRDVVLKLALLARTEQRWGDAVEWCREAIGMDPADIEPRMNLASALVRLGDREGARAEYREVLARAPDRAEAWGLLGSLYSEEGMHDDARLALERAVELKPEDALLRANLARGLEDSGRVEAALAEYDRALALDPVLPAAVNGQALLLAHEGRVRDAVKHLRDALPALEKDLDTLNNLAWLLVDHLIDPAEALEVATRARALAPDDPVVLDTWGWAAFRAGRAAEAVAPLEQAWKATGDAEVRAHLGAALAASGQELEGREHARAAAAANPRLERIPEVARLLR